ncbi:RRQRL motif-containing zinc-binding protein [Streptomyces sp. DW26H14]|uniref:RRQRL motif-containing zinc-binding protein n=1 Tax=Streptomyces sp. DW26H14 TaxID=3435395 RepID=UPI00403D7497
MPPRRHDTTTPDQPAKEVPQVKFFDPEGKKYGFPTYPFKLAPEGLATKGQLRKQGLRPGGQPVVAQMMWRPAKKHRRKGMAVAVAYLYRIDLALPVRPMTPGRWRAHEAMMRPRRTCPICRTDVGYVIRTSVGMCEPCEKTHDPLAALAA